MTEATKAVTTIATSPAAPLTTVDNLFSLSHQVFNQYRTTIFILTGTCMFFSVSYSYYSMLLFSYDSLVI